MSGSQIRRLSVTLAILVYLVAFGGQNARLLELIGFAVIAVAIYLVVDILAVRFLARLAKARNSGG